MAETRVSKRVVILGLGILLILLGSLYYARIAQNPSRGASATSGVVLIGWNADQSDNASLEKAVGRPAAIQYAYYSVSSDFSASTSEAVRQIADGSIPMLNWIPHQDGNNIKDSNYCGGVTAANVVAGMFDGPNMNPYTGKENPGFFAQAEEIKSLKVPVIVGWYGQLTDSIPDTCFYTDKSPSIRGPEYVAAWRHVVSIFKEVGATNAQFVWAPAAALMSKGNDCNLNGKNNLPEWQCYYPGSAWVDWVSNDHYDHLTSGLADYDQDTDIVDWYNAVKSLGKPLMQRQTGAVAVSTQTPDPQSEWITTAHTSINPSLASSTENTFPALRAFVYHDTGSGPGSASDAGNFLLQDLGANKGLTDFVEMADDPYFEAASSSISQYFSSTGGDPDNITAPSNLKVFPETSSSISISWSASQDKYAKITGYDIFRDGVVVGETTNATSYIDTGLTTSGTHTYSVEAYDANGYYSAQSSLVQASAGASGN